MFRGLKMVGVLGLALTSLAAGCVAEEDEEEHIASEWNNAYENRGSCSGVTVPDQSGFNKRVALTFDDGPNSATTPVVLDILKEHDIKATFFINGKRVTGDSEWAILDRILEEGHILANHSQGHQNMVNLSASELDRQIKETDDIIRQAGATPKYFRFPFGSSNCTTAERVESYGYTITGWHVDTADWCFASAKGGVGHCDKRTFKYVPDSFRDDMVGLTLSQVADHNGGIVLFHDIHQNTVNNLDPIIRGLQQDGYSFVNVDDVATFPLLNGETLPFVGDACESAGDCEFATDGATASCLEYDGPQGESLGMCTIACDGYCPDQGGKAATFCTSLDGGVSGTCVSKAARENEQCASIPGTVATDMMRFVQASGASGSTATVCVPAN